MLTTSELLLQVVLGPSANLQMQGSLLQLRGISPGVTPVKDSRGNMLVLNGKLGLEHCQLGCTHGSSRLHHSSMLTCSAGEIFGGLDIAPRANDSRTLLQALSSGTVPHVFNCLRGPWAAVYWHAHTRTLWFGRDVLGMASVCLPACMASLLTPILGDCPENHLVLHGA